MATTVAEKRAKFRSLHQEGCFVLPNPWDAGSARMLQHLGFAALASTSTGYAWTTGRPDLRVITIIDRPLIEIIDGWSSRGDLRVPVASSPVCLFAEGASFALATR